MEIHLWTRVSTITTAIQSGDAGLHVGVKRLDRLIVSRRVRAKDAASDNILGANANDVWSSRRVGRIRWNGAMDD